MSSSASPSAAPEHLQSTVLNESFEEVRHLTRSSVMQLADGARMQSSVLAESFEESRWRFMCTEQLQPPTQDVRQQLKGDIVKLPSHTLRQVVKSSSPACATPSAGSSACSSTALPISPAANPTPAVTLAQHEPGTRPLAKLGGVNMYNVLSPDEQSERDSYSERSESSESSADDESSRQLSALQLPSSSTLARYTQYPSPVVIPPNSIGLTYLHSFLSAAECAQLIELSAGRFYRSTTTSGVSSHSTSHSAVPTGSHPVVKVVRVRVAQLTGVKDSQIERLRVVRYEPGQQFLPHYDSSHADSPRSHTVFAYLNDVPGGGGETEFTRLGVKFKPKCGDALFWENRADRESYHKDGIHAGRSPVSGVKYGLNVFVRFHDKD